MSRTLFWLALGLPLLAACSEQQVSTVQQTASAAIAVAGKQLADASAPLAGIRQQADDVAGKVGVLADAAAILQPDIREQVDALKQQAGALREVVAAWQGTDDWRVLTQQVGTYPRTSGLFEQPPLAAPLAALLGKDLARFKLYMATQSPLQQDKVLFVTGNKRHAAQEGAAYLLIDPVQRKLEAGLLENGVLKVYATEGTALYVPAEVRTFTRNLVP